MAGPVAQIIAQYNDAREPTRTIRSKIKGKMVKAANLPLLRWHGGGNHRDTQQAKMAIGDVF